MTRNVKSIAFSLQAFTISNKTQSYRNWWSPWEDTSGDTCETNNQETFAKQDNQLDDFWQEYYKPHLFSSLHNIFAYNVNTTVRYLGAK